jgi:hypothetical protein
MVLFKETQTSYMPLAKHTPKAYARMQRRNVCPYQMLEQCASAQRERTRVASKVKPAKGRGCRQALAKGTY